MMMQKGQQFRCQNRECAAEIEVTRDSTEGESRIGCSYGVLMKKPYTEPVLSLYDVAVSIPTKYFTQRAWVFSVPRTPGEASLEQNLC
jgi:hypothetical protein